jgi:hypothetical protein
MGLALGVAIVVGLLELGAACGGAVAAVRRHPARIRPQPIVGLLRERLGTSAVARSGRHLTFFARRSSGLPSSSCRGEISQASTCLEPAVVRFGQGWASTLRPAALGTSVKALKVDSVAASSRAGGAPPAAPQVVRVGHSRRSGAASLATPDHRLLLDGRTCPGVQRYLLAFVPAEQRGGTRRRGTRSRRGSASGSRPTHPDGHDGAGDRDRLRSSGCPAPCSSD